MVAPSEVRRHGGAAASLHHHDDDESSPHPETEDFLEAFGYKRELCRSAAAVGAHDAGELGVQPPSPFRIDDSSESDEPAFSDFVEANRLQPDRCGDDTRERKEEG
eukprot:GHVU01125144.1.p5 GENE.GHVU01125144.1~~GHVU01125144.1.p5  ORF type:complete len:106 (+),score=23.40 GHVU01125144.1:1742-2059(+)